MMGAARSLFKVKEGPKQVRKVPSKPPVSSVPHTEAIESSNEEMLKRLQTIFVESTTTQQRVHNPYKSGILPQDRSPILHDIMDVSENVDGYLTVKQTIEVLEHHRLKTKTLESIAKEYHINIKNLSNLLDYFGNFYVTEHSNIKNSKLKFHPLHR